MQINYSIEAFSSLVGVVNFIESKNTLGAGKRWLAKFETFFKNALFKPSSIKLCNNQTFFSLNLRCLNFNDWIIAFSIKKALQDFEWGFIKP